jgi:HK97 family phage major capsid protein
VATVEERVKALNEQRMRIWEQSKALLDGIGGRDLSNDESAQFDRMLDAITAIDKERDGMLSSESTQRTVDIINEEARRASGAGYNPRVDEARAIVDDFFRPVRAPGRTNAMYVNLERGKNVVEGIRDGLDGPELRLIAGDTGSSGGSLTVPTLVASSIYQYMTAEVAMRRMPTTKITTPNGDPMNFPRVNAHGIATQIANTNTAFSGTDPSFAMVTFNSYDFGQLVYVSNDLLEDTNVNMLDFVSQNIGRAIGQYTATAYVTGSGSNTVNGIQTVTPTGSAGTIATGGSLIIGPAGQEMNKLIDVVYGVNTSYRDSGKCAWLMRDSTAATIRKLRSGGAGTIDNYLWQPSPTVGLIGGQPDSLLGYPVYTDPNVASMASDAKICFFGSWDSYYIRDTIGLRLERSDDLKFDLNQAAFRGLLRTDGDSLDATAIVTLHQAVS